MISIIVPIYMVDEMYLRKCIDSIRNQTYENIEIILIDDGSPDKSGEIIEEYSKLDSRIKVIHKNNSGVSATRNIGIDKSKGEWIIFVDSDDWLEYDTCESLLNKVNDNIDIVVARAVKEYKEETVSYNNKNINKIIETDMEKKEIMNCIFLNKNTKYQTVDTPWGKLYRKQFLINNSIKFNENLKLGEDGLLNFKAFYLARNIKYLNKEIYHYRINPKSVCNTFNNNIINTYIKLFEYYEDILKKCNFDFSDEYDYFLFRQLKNFMKKYFFSKKNNKTDEILKEELYNIVHTTRFLEMIIRSLNNNKYITIKDKILLRLVTNKKYYYLLKIYFRR